MDPFADLLGFGSAPAPAAAKGKPATSGLEGLNFNAPPASAPAPAASGFNFMAAPPTAAPAPAASGFSFMGMSSPAPAPAPTASMFDDLTFGGSSGGGGGGGGGLAGLSAIDALASQLAGASDSHSTAMPTLGTHATAAAASASTGAGAGRGGSAADAYDARTDFSKLSAGELKRYLAACAVPHGHCVEKKELAALAASTAAARAKGGAAASAANLTAGLGISSGSTVVSSGAGSGMGGSGSGGGAAAAAAASLLATAMPNAFEVAGFASIAPDAVRSLDQDRAYHAAATSSGGVVGDVASFLTSLRKMPLVQMPIPTLPQGRLGVRLPAAAVNPVIREVPQSYFRDSVVNEATTISMAAGLQTGSSGGTAGAGAGGGSASGSGGSGAAAAPAPAAAAAAPALTDAQKALLPFLGQQLVGPRRYFEVPLRVDASGLQLLAGIVAAGRAVGLEVTHATAQSVVLQQKVSVPSSAWSAFASSPSVVGVGGRHPVVIYKGKGDAPAAATSTGLLSGFFNSRTVYVNCVAVYIGSNVANERVAMISAGRWLADTAAPATGSNATGAGASAGGVASVVSAAALRTINKDRVNGVTQQQSGSSSSSSSSGSSSGSGAKTGGAAASASLGGLMELESASSGIQCALVNKRSPPRTSYRPDRLSAARARAATAHADGAASSNNNAAAADDMFGLSAAAASASSSSSSSSAEGEGEEGGLLRVPQLNPLTRLQAQAGPGVDVPVDAVDEEKREIPIEEVNGCWKGYDDGSEIIGDGSGAGGAAGTAQPDWSHLRVSFLDPDIRTATGAAATSGAGAAKASAGPLSDVLSGLASGVSGRDGSSSETIPSFSLTDVEDECVALACSLASCMRGQGIAADCVWSDALAAARRAVAVARGDEVLPPALQPTPAAAAVAAQGKAVAQPLMVHPDAVAAVKSCFRAAGEVQLFKAVAGYEARAKHAEGLCGYILRATATALRLTATPMQLPPFVPALAAMPLDMTDDSAADVAAAVSRYGAEAAATSAIALTARSAAEQQQQRQRLQAGAAEEEEEQLLAPTVPGLTGIEDTVRSVYARAYLYTRRLGHAAAVLAQVAEHAVDLEIRARLQRKKAHVALRCGAAFYHAVAVLSALQEHGVSSELKTDVGRALLVQQFGVSDEACLLHTAASSYKLLGEVAVTINRLVFHANVLGFRTKKSIGIESIVAVHRSATVIGGLVDNTLTVTYVDEEKVAAAAKAKEKEKDKAAKSSATTATTTAAASASLAPAAELDAFFGGLSVTSSSTVTGASSSGGSGASSSAAPAAPAASQTPLSIGDAFGDLCEMGDMGSSSSSSTSASASGSSSGLGGLSLGGSAAPPAAAPAAAPTAPAKAGTATPAASSTVLIPGLTEPLTQEDMFTFLSGGSDASTLSQLHVTPVPTTTEKALDRDVLYYLLQLLRQLDSRPHLTCFEFLPLTVTPAAAAGLPRVDAPDMHAWLQQQAEAGAVSAPPPLKPLLLRRRPTDAMASLLGPSGGKAGSKAGAAAAASGAQSDMSDLFSFTPAPAPAAAPVEVVSELVAEPAPVSGYDDLSAIGASDEL